MKCALHFSGESLAMRLFWHGVPAEWPEEPLVLVRDEEGRRADVTVHDEPEPVTIERGTFESCLKLTHQLSTYHLPFDLSGGLIDAANTETRTVWLAQG